MVSSTLDPANRLPPGQNTAIDYKLSGKKLVAQLTKQFPEPWSQKKQKGTPARGPSLEPKPWNFILTASPSGNVNSDIIFNIFKDHVLPWVVGLGVVNLEVIGDAHSTHMSEKLMELFEEHEDLNIQELLFPGHASTARREGLSGAQEVFSQVPDCVGAFFEKEEC